MIGLLFVCEHASANIAIANMAKYLKKYLNILQN